MCFWQTVTIIEDDFTGAHVVKGNFKVCVFIAVILVTGRVPPLVVESYLGSVPELAILVSHSNVTLVFENRINFIIIFFIKYCLCSK